MGIFKCAHKMIYNMHFAFDVASVNITENIVVKIILTSVPLPPDLHPND